VRPGSIILNNVINGPDLYLKLTILLRDLQILKGDGFYLVVECDDAVIKFFLGPQLILLAGFHRNFY